jgi:putative redox protein
MEVTVEHLGAVKFEIKARQHTIACDQPPENGGYDEGMTPPEHTRVTRLLRRILRRAISGKFKLATEGTHVRVGADQVKDPVARIDNFRIEIETPVDLSDQHRAGVERAVHHCLIHNTLLHPPKIAIDIKEHAVTHQ